MASNNDAYSALLLAKPVLEHYRRYLSGSPATWRDPEWEARVTTAVQAVTDAVEGYTHSASAPQSGTGIPHFNLPMTTDDHASFLWVTDDKGTQYSIAQIRGWGHLTGQGGGLGLTDEAADSIQRKVAAFIVEACNSHGAQDNSVIDRKQLESLCYDIKSKFRGNTGHHDYDKADLLADIEGFLAQRGVEVSNTKND